MLATNAFPEWVPPEIIDGYSEKGLRALFDWQIDVLNRRRENFVFCAPTSAGKSLVAELLGLKAALKEKRVLFVLPYVAVAKEKLMFLQKLWKRLDIQVAGFIGSTSAPTSEWTSAVCTLEKANSLISHAIFDGTLHEYGMIIIDEIHMVLDCSRGPTLESLLTKLNYYNANNTIGEKIDIIGMSVTLPNIEKIGKWLKAEVYETTFRPIVLQNCYSCDGVLYTVEEKKEIRRLDKKFRYPGDLDCTIGFCVEAALSHHPTLVFCSSKNDVEKIALDIARYMDLELKTKQYEDLLSQPKLLELKYILEKTCKQVDPLLAKTLPRGVAYHHAGLTTEERECVEKAFREGTIYALVATSTLFCGVNLPASRVIIKAQIRGPTALNSTTYDQMAGRAGRMGFAEQGVSILTIRPSEVDKALRLTKTPPNHGNDTRDASKVILESVCSGLTPNISSVVSLTSQLLHSPQYSPQQTITELTSQSLISGYDDEENMGSENIVLTGTQLGSAALASSLPPDAALFVYADLKNATMALAIDTELHMMYLVTPINCSVWQGCDWNHLYSIYAKMNSNQKRVAKMVGVNERFMLGRVSGGLVQSNDREFQLHLRFFSALALFDVISEVPVVEVAKKFRIYRGALQQLQQQSATYAAMIVAFCNRLGWQYLRSLLEGFASRLAFGIRAELTELIRVDGIDGSRARVFHSNGITSLAQLAQSTPQEVSKVLSLAVPFESGQENGVKQKWLFGEEKMTLQEAAQIVLSRAEDGVREIMRNLGIEIGKNNTSWIKHSTQAALPAIARCKSQEIKLKPRRRISETVNNEIITFRSPLADRSINSVKEEKSPISTILTKENKSFSSSTPVGQTRPPRISFACSHISDDSSVDVFSNSIMEMSLNERETSVIQPTNATEEREVDELETSLLKVTRETNIVEDSFDQPVELVSNEKTRFSSKEIEDSFDISISQLIVPKTQCSVKDDIHSPSVVEADSSNVQNDSADIFDDSFAKPTKRIRVVVECSSSLVASPMPKTRCQSSQFSPDFYIEDVCQTESTWNSFITRSNQWETVSIALVVDKNGNTTAISLCPYNEKPSFIPLADEDFKGTTYEEIGFPSYTPCQRISIEKRKEHLRKLFQLCTVYCFHALSACETLEKSLNILIKKPICVQYISFLALHRQGDQPLTFHDLASRFNWPFSLEKIMKMGKRISTSAQSFICSRLYSQLILDAIENSSKNAIELEIASIQVVASITSAGFSYSQDTSKKILARIRKKLDELEDDCHKYAGRSFNIESSTAVSDVLFNRLHIPHPGGLVPGKRHLSANKEVLVQIEHIHPIVPLIKQYRQIKHAITHCLRPLQDHVIGNNVIKTSFDICTATGRLLSNTPNIQNIPKGELIDGVSVRSLFAAKPGRIFLAADYCQLELRVLAHLSEDPALLERLAIDGRDFFADVSKEWGFPRDSVKQLCYGLIYGMGITALAESTKTKPENAQKLFDSFFSSFPKVKTFIKQMKEDAEKVGYVTTMLKRRRITTQKGRQVDRARDDRQTVNFTIQGTASEIFKKALVNIHKRLKGIDAYIVMIVHDEILIDSCEKLKESVSEILKHEMENVFTDFKVPFKVKQTSGYNWYDLS